LTLISNNELIRHKQSYAHQRCNPLSVSSNALPNGPRAGLDEDSSSHVPQSITCQSAASATQFPAEAKVLNVPSPRLDFKCRHCCTAREHDAPKGREEYPARFLNARPRATPRARRATARYRTLIPRMPAARMAAARTPRTTHAAPSIIGG
jgi:hypothetical protein